MQAKSKALAHSWPTRLRNRARASMRFAVLCEQVGGHKSWALDARLKAWELERQAVHLERQRVWEGG